MIAGRAAASANVRRKAKEMRKEHAAMRAEEKIQVDAWFNGYQKSLGASVWVGFDQPKTLGRAEYGGRAALPIWIEFMKHALDSAPEDIPQLPMGVIATRIDPETGAKTSGAKNNSIREFFLLENPPKDAKPEAVIPSNNGQAIQTPHQLF